MCLTQPISYNLNSTYRLAVASPQEETADWKQKSVSEERTFNFHFILQAISVQCIDPVFEIWFRPCMIRPWSRDSNRKPLHVVELEDSDCCEVVESDTSEAASEVSSIISGR